MAQEYGLGAVPFAFLGREQSAELRLNAQHLEEILRDRYAAEALRLALAAEQIVADAVKGEVRGHVGKRFVALPQVQQMPDLSGLARQAVGVVVGDPDETLGLMERQGAKQESIDHAEYRGTGADAEADNQDRERGESRILTEGSKCVAQILEDAVQCRQTSAIGHDEAPAYFILAC